MAKLAGSGADWRLDGVGFAEVPMSFFGWGELGGEYCSVIFHGDLRLRVLRENRDARPLSVYVADDNWLWPLWWLVARLAHFAQKGRQIGEEKAQIHPLVHVEPHTI